MQIGTYDPNYLSAFSLPAFGKVAAARPPQGPPLHAKLDKPVDKDTHRVLASELVRRLDQNSMRAEQDTEGQGFDASKHLQLSISKAFTKVEKEFGHAAAVAVMGIFTAAVDDGNVSEEAVGEAMLDSVRFMDRNFGFAAGDKLIALFNRDLNRRVNEYFDNGLNEQIYTAVQVNNSIGRAVSQISNAILEKFGRQDADAAASILEEALENAEGGLNSAFREGMRDVAAYLEEKYGVEATAPLATEMAEATQGSAAPPPPGTVLDVAV